MYTEKPIVYGAYHFVSCLKGFNNSVAYSLKYQIDILLSAVVLFKIQVKPFSDAQILLVIDEIFVHENSSDKICCPS